VNGPAVFGDFLDADRGQLGPPAGHRRASERGGDVQQVNDSLLRILVLMGRYVQDVTAGSGTVRARGRRGLTAWGRAGAEAREALSNAAASLHEPEGLRVALLDPPPDAASTFLPLFCDLADAGRLRGAHVTILRRKTRDDHAPQARHAARAGPRLDFHTGGPSPDLDLAMHRPSRWGRSSPSPPPSRAATGTLAGWISEMAN
jgi:hypothetical protein